MKYNRRDIVSYLFLLVLPHPRIPPPFCLRIPYLVMLMMLMIVYLSTFVKVCVFVFCCGDSYDDFLYSNPKPKPKPKP